MAGRAQDSLRTRLCAALAAHMAGGRLDLPEGALPLWNGFCELSAARSWHAAGPNPIGFAEIEAWARLMRWPLEPHHVAILRALDQAWIAATLEELHQDKARRSDARKAAAALTPALFDLMTR